MKKNLLYSLLAGACLASVASCDVNAWNDKLDGFEGDPAATNKQAVEYTLTAADYANLAANSDNIAKAGDALSKQLKAVGTQHYFTNEISAKEYIPNFLSDPDFSYFTLSDGSSIKITYNTAAEMPEDVVAFGSATEYTLIGEDYILATCLLVAEVVGVAGDGVSAVERAALLGDVGLLGGATHAVLLVSLVETHHTVLGAEEIVVGIGLSLDILQIVSAVSKLTAGSAPSLEAWVNT